MRRSSCAVLFLAAFAAIVTPAGAETGTIVVNLHAAHAIEETTDQCPLCNQEDFYVRVLFPSLPVQISPVIDGRDDPSWETLNPWKASETVSKLQRFQEFTVQLFDEDNAPSDPDDHFDINPDPTRIDQTIRFDTCDMTWTIAGNPSLFVTHGPTSDQNLARGNGGNDPGSVSLLITTGDGLPFTINDVSIVGLIPVQASFDLMPVGSTFAAKGSRFVVSGKPTAVRIEIASTYTGPVLAVPVTITATDHMTTWTETQVLDIPAGRTKFYFFDGLNGHQPPFVPIKPANNDTWDLTYSASLLYNEIAPPGTSVEFQDCYQADNATQQLLTPMVRTHDPSVVFRPFDFFDDGVIDTIGLPSYPQVQAMAAQDETYRLASWPLASAGGVAVAVPYLPFGGWNVLNPSEPFLSIAKASTMAMLAGDERWVLVTKRDWFKFPSNRLRNILFWPGQAIGLSLGEFTPHAVIAEDGHFAVSTHELGHTFKLSQHKCSNGGVLEKYFGKGCRDEYNFPWIDGAPFPANGLDVAGSVYPQATSDTDNVPRCMAVTAGTREVCLRNIMDANSTTAINWTDTSTYDYLAEVLRERADPMLVTISGSVLSPGWYNSIATAPVWSGSLEFAYQTTGVPDILDPPVGGTSSGAGQFAVRTTTAFGSAKTYRFNPMFSGDGSTTPLDGAYFSFSIPWDPSIQEIALLGPSDARDPGCDNGPPCSMDLMVAQLVRSAGAPVVGPLRAGKDVPPPLVGADPGAPIIGPGHDAVVAWGESDPDSAELRTAVMVSLISEFGSPVKWYPLTVDLNTNQFRISHDWLVQEPGDYMAQVIVSDGLNSTPFISGKVFSICNFTNGGVERCDGIDDDCNGVINDALAPPGSAGLTMTKTAVSWSGLLAADDYDLTRGDLAVLHSTHGDFSIATQQCVVSHTAATQTAYASNPSPGVGWWFVARGNNCVAHGTYNEGNDSQGVPRDPGIAASPVHCP